MAVLACLVNAGLLLPGCELLGRNRGHLLPLDPVTSTGAEQPEILFKQLQTKPEGLDRRPPAELYPSNAAPVGIPSRQATRPAADKKDTFTFNFDDADLGEVAKVIIGDTLKMNYVLNPKVAGKVTLQTTQPLTKDELLPTLEMVLQMNNAALINNGGIYHIEPVADALFRSDVSTFGQRVGYQTRVIPIRYVAVQDLVEVLKPLVQEKTILSVDKTKNLMVASGSPDDIDRVMDMVNTFDTDLLNGRSFGLFPLVHAEPEAIIKELEEIFAKTDDESGFFRFVPIERLNAVLAITHQAKYLRDIENWVFRLDKATTAAGGGVNVYKVQHADAEMLAGTLNEIFTGAAPQDTAAKVAPGKKAAEVTNRESPAGQGQDASPTRTASSRLARTPTRTGRPGSSPGGTATVANVKNVKIIADKANNALVVVATPREYNEIFPVIKQLDILPLQVLIDATIVSVDLKDNLKYGIQWFLRHKENSISSGNSAEALGRVAQAGAAGFATGGLSMVFNSGTVNAILTAQATKDNINVISSPSLMVLNNQSALINVGDQVPILTGSTAVPIAGGGNAGAALAQANTIQYRDTGVILEVTPRVNANGMVIMEISQQVSSVKTQTTGELQSATIAQKEIKSSVAVQNGETIVLGGLITENDTRNRAGIPWLQELPWLGSLFGTTQDDIARTELVVLITPRVVASRHDANLISNEFKRKLTGIYEPNGQAAIK